MEADASRKSGFVNHLDRSVMMGGAAGAFALLIGLVEPAFSYAPRTHAEIGAVAVDRSNLDSILKTQYRIEPGAAAVFR
jgi:hypothetical protein